MKKLCVLLLLSITSMTTSAAIYKWVDKNGSVNDGKELSGKYKNNPESVNKEIIVADSTSVTKKSNSYPNEAKNNASCSAKKAEYQKSLNCFRGCSTPTANGGRNISNCKCKNVSKPSC